MTDAPSTTPPAPRRARLVLEDGRSFEGIACGVDGEVAAEVVFNTALTGYQEILTDPSYCGQTVVLTATQIGNYGCNPDDDESDRVWARGLIVREASRIASNQRSTRDLRGWLQDRGVVAAEEMDTRAIVKHIRTRGAMMGILTTADTELDELARRAAALPGMEGQDLASVVSCREPYRFEDGLPEIDLPSSPEPVRTASGRHSRNAERATATPTLPPPPPPPPRPEPLLPLVVLDFGVKRSILRHLVETGFDVEVVPGDTPAEAILARSPAGVLLSNGPGDPAAVTHGVETARALLGRTPILGICLGHQILALAAGCKTFKLKFGHHGGNHPVKDHRTERVAVSSQNHGFAVDAASVAESGFAPWFTNLNDQTCAGLHDEARGILSVQFHPEAGPGPHDVATIFGRFRELILARRASDETKTAAATASKKA